MAVGINMPTRAPEERPQEDPLDKVLKGLNVAATVYGIKLKHDEVVNQENKIKADVYSEHGQVAGDQVLGQMGLSPGKPPASATPSGPPPIGVDPNAPPIGPTPFLGKRQIEANKANQEYATKLRTERAGSGITKETSQIATAYKRLSKSDNTPAGNIALIYSYMKMLDPGSSVKEGEFATAEQTTGIPGKIVNTYNSLLKGYQLDKTQRAQFMHQAQGLYSGQLEKMAQFDKTYQHLAQKANVPWEDVNIDYGMTPDEQSPIVKSFKGSGQPTTKIIDGVTFRKVPGGWEEVPK